MISQLKSFIDSHSASSKKILALSVVPKSMSYSEVVETFGVSTSLAIKARAEVKKYGILSVPGSKIGHGVSEETKEIVMSFYLQDDMSRPLPGLKDTVSVKQKDGKRVHKRKRLVLSTLGNLHNLYLKDHGKHNYVSMGKFCELRPKECVLAGRAGTHVICVCAYHENPKLMFENANLKSETMTCVKDCMMMMLCPTPTRECYLLQCSTCPGRLNLQEALEVYLDSEMIDNVTYNQWESTDRGNLLTVTKSSDEFISDFIYQMELLIPHDYVNIQQTKFIKQKTENLEEGEILVSLDFAKNYSFVIQNSAQSQYFKNKEATIHPFVVYYRNPDGSQSHLCVAIISDHMDHNTVAVHAFQAKLLSYLKEKLEFDIKKIYYVSDGCAAQYKNKKAAANVWYHEKDFGMPAELHYHATSHGKSACDGIGGMLKHVIALHSLRVTQPGQQITTPLAFYQYADANIKGVKCLFVETSDVQAHEKKLMVRHTTANDITGILSHHAIIPVQNSPSVMIKMLSSDESFVMRTISTKESQLDFSEVRGFVMYCNDDVSLQLGCVSDSDESTDIFTMQVLQPTGKPYSYEFNDQTIEVFLQDIISLVTPYFQCKGQIVKLRAAELRAAEVLFKNQRRA